MRCRVLIAGAGPAGLGAALLLDTLGWTDIVIVERRSNEQGFDRGRAFNYQLEGRGIGLLERVGITAATLRRFGLPNDHFTLTTFAPDGKSKTMQPPILVPGRKTPYWMTRSRLLALLEEAMQPVIERGSVTVLYDHQFAGFEQQEGSWHARIRSGNGDERLLQPELVLGCDGLGSAVRRSLSAMSSVEAERLRRIEHPSPAADLAYKVLNLPPQFAVCGGNARVHDHAMAYAFTSTYRNTGERMALFALPVATSSDPRSINIILPHDHRFWQLDSEADVRDYLAKGFPQIDVAAVAGSDEFADFVAATPGRFPQPQYTRHIHSTLPADDGTSEVHCVLIGDAAHAFPPDLGMGVNSALEDVAELESYLGAADLGAALTEYASQREPEHAALVRLVQSVHPYQYNQSPWRLKRWTAAFLAQLLLHKATFGLVEMPGFMLSQVHTMPFTEMEQRYRRGRWTMRFVGIGLFAVAAAFVWPG